MVEALLSILLQKIPGFIIPGLFAGYTIYSKVSTCIVYIIQYTVQYTLYSVQSKSESLAKFFLHYNNIWLWHGIYLTCIYLT